MAGELEVEPGFSLTQQIGIVLASLTDDDQLSLIDLVKNVRAALLFSRGALLTLTPPSATRSRLRRTNGDRSDYRRRQLGSRGGGERERRSDQTQGGTTPRPFQGRHRALHWAQRRVWQRGRATSGVVERTVQALASLAQMGELRRCVPVLRTRILRSLMHLDSPRIRRPRLVDPRFSPPFDARRRHQDH